MVKEYNGTNRFYQFYSQKRSVMQIIALIVLCSFFYILGIWNNTYSVPIISTGLGCATNNINISSSSVSLDFEAHHMLGVDDISNSTQSFVPCDMKYSEYTPCEDPVRSLKYDREMLRYRERHCPEKKELLKCLIPAPPGYKNPFSWPKSRDFAWFSNVPHRELSVEKAVQNWIQVDGDKFHFPGGGTMFPHGEDAYIENIKKLIPLTDGSIKTAFDTGCGKNGEDGSLDDLDYVVTGVPKKDIADNDANRSNEMMMNMMLG